MIAATALAMTACGTTRTVYVEPECSPPPKPSPPEVSADELAPLPGDVYWRVTRRDKQLEDWGLEQRAMLREVCGD